MKRAWIAGVLASLPAAALWAHPGTGPHVHPEELGSLIAVLLVMVLAAAGKRTPRRRG